ncbi:hypothetical protein GCM10010378_38260 [Streptomyces viridochromogenes]
MLTPSAEATSAILTAATPRASICSTAARSRSARRSATLNRTLALATPSPYGLARTAPARPPGYAVPPVSGASRTVP